MTFPYSECLINYWIGIRIKRSRRFDTPALEEPFTIFFKDSSRTKFSVSSSLSVKTRVKYTERIKQEVKDYKLGNEVWQATEAP